MSLLLAVVVLVAAPFAVGAQTPEPSTSDLANSVTVFDPTRSVTVYDVAKSVTAVTSTRRGP